MSDFILSVNNVSKSFHTNGSEKLTVLNSIDLSIDAASSAADKLADYAALRKQDEATS